MFFVYFALLLFFIRELCPAVVFAIVTLFFLLHYRGDLEKLLLSINEAAMSLLAIDPDMSMM